MVLCYYFIYTHSKLSNRYAVKMFSVEWKFLHIGKGFLIGAGCIACWLCNFFEYPLKIKAVRPFQLLPCQ
jgi:hypothetical protein